MDTLQKAKEIEDDLRAELASLKELEQTPEVARQVAQITQRLHRPNTTGLQEYRPTGWYLSPEPGRDAL